mgnify:CR=1 FL=1
MSYGKEIDNLMKLQNEIKKHITEYGENEALEYCINIIQEELENEIEYYQQKGE